MPAFSRSATACMSRTSSRTRATAAFQTLSMSPMAASGVRAMLSSTVQCACDGNPRSLARAARLARISVITGLLSCGPAWSPRVVNMRHTFSRSSRRVE
jgi:hypothetical protein